MDAIDFVAIAIPSLCSLQRINFPKSRTISTLGFGLLTCFLVTHLTDAIKIFPVFNCIAKPCGRCPLFEASRKYVSYLVEYRRRI